MTDFAFLKLLVRLVGLLLIGLAISPLLQGAGMVVAMLGSAGPFSMGAFGSDMWMMILYLGAPAGALLQFMIGLNLLLGGKWLVERCRRDMIGRCGLCGYDIKGLRVPVCPECGAQIEVLVRKQENEAS